MLKNIRTLALRTHITPFGPYVRAADRMYFSIDRAMGFKISANYIFKYIIISDIRTGTKSIQLVLQMLVIGDEAPFVLLSHKMKSDDLQSSLKHPTFYKNRYL